MKYLLLIGVALLLALPARAQATLTLLTPVTGRVDDSSPQSWQFNATEGNLLSFVVAASGGLDPLLTISNSAGAVVIANDDYNYPASGDALLEAITIPRTDRYTATVSAVGGTSGEYTLTMLPGYGQISTSENFGSDTGWQGVDDTVQVSVADGELALSLDRAQQAGIAVNPTASIPDIYYADVTVNVGAESAEWSVGMTARQTDSRYYLLALNHQGQWRFSVRDGGAERVIRDWVAHPAILPGSRTFRLAMLVNGSNFDFFFNGNLFGRQSDPSIPAGGTLGLAVLTSTRAVPVGARFDDLTITTPRLMDGRPALPTQLIVGTPAAMTQELQRRNVIPAGGEMALNVAESFAESARPGVERFMLGRGSTFRTFALGTTFTWEAGAAGMTGCGLVFGQTSDTDYLLAYADRTGGYGLSQRQGDSFLPGIFGEKPVGSKTSYHLLVVALADRVLYYVDGVYAGALDQPAAEGAVGNAVVNFEPITTSCRFADTWVWRWN
ncbi:MAG: hypothetical protein HZC41_20895 [Chloroflexi bacterium]|nr:hypothetical protein [Chloroflexota bacterium]